MTSREIHDCYIAELIGVLPDFTGKTNLAQQIAPLIQARAQWEIALQLAVLNERQVRTPAEVPPSFPALIQELTDLADRFRRTGGATGTGAVNANGVAIDLERLIARYTTV